MKNENHHYSSMDMSMATEPFILVAEPHAKRVDGFPLDSLSIDIGTGKGFYGFGRSFAPLSYQGISQAETAAIDERLKTAQLQC